MSERESRTEAHFASEIDRSLKGGAPEEASTTTTRSSADTTSKVSATISALAGLMRRRDATKPPKVDPSHTATKIDPSSRENTARVLLSMLIRYRYQRISSPIPRTPVQNRTPQVRSSRRRSAAPSAPSAAGEGRRCSPASCALASRRAPTAATKLRSAAMHCVARSPKAGMNAKSTSNAPAAAPAVLKP